MTDDEQPLEPTADPAGLADLLAESFRAGALQELTEQAAPDPDPPAPVDTPQQLAIELAALQVRVAALTPTSTTTSITTKGLR